MRRRVVPFVAAIGLSLAGLVWYVTYDRIRFEERQAVQEAYRHTANLSVALEEQVGRTLGGLETLLSVVAHEYLERRSVVDVQAVLRSFEWDTSLLNNLFVADAGGRIRASLAPTGPLDVSDRPYFQSHLGPSPLRNAFVGEPTIGRITGLQTVHVSVAIRDPAGRFLGVAAAALNPDHFLRFNEKADLGREGLLTVVHAQTGITLARRAGNVNTYGADMRGSTLVRSQAAAPVGQFVSRGVLEGVPRFYGYRRLARYPVIAAVGMSQAEVLEPFRQRSRNYVQIAALGTALIAGAGLAAVLVIGRISRSETRYRRIFEGAIEGMFEASARGRITAANRALARVLGYEHGRELVGRAWDEVFRVQGEAERREYDARLARDGRLHGFECRIERRDGTAAWVRVSVSREDDASGKAVRYEGVLENIDDRRKAEEALRAADEALRESQKMEAVGQLAGGIAHDFNNLLAAILGNVDLAAAEAEGRGELRRSLEQIRSAGLRGRELVAQILSFSRRHPTEKRAVDPAAVVREAASLLAATLPPRIEVSVSAPDATRAVMADATQLTQVLMNLGTNAARAIAGSGRIEFAVSGVALAGGRDARLEALPDGDYVRIAVRDTGCGMDAETQRHIFEPFFTTRPVGEGTGLGLPVAQGIVRTHGGVMTVDSRPGDGSTFSVYFPAVQRPPEAAKPAPPASPEALRGTRVLCVDDDELVLSMVCRTLERQGCDVRAASDPAEALRHIRAGLVFDVLLTDHNMPGGSGIDLARDVRREQPQLPIAIMSGFIDEELARQAADCGVRMVFKPHMAEELPGALRELTARAAALP